MPYFKLDLEDEGFAVVHVHKAHYLYETGEIVSKGIGWDVSVNYQRYYYGWGNKWAYIGLNSNHDDHKKDTYWNTYKFNNTVYEIEVHDIVNVSVCSRKFYHQNKVLKEEPKKNSYVVRDSQKSRMYKSERFYSKSQTLSNEEVGIYFELIFESDFYIKLSSRFTQYINRDVSVVLKDKDTRWAYGDGREITLPNWAKNEMVILHELSHTIIYRLFPMSEIRERKIQGHGKEFCFIFALMVKEFMPENYDGLIDGYNTWNVKYLTEMLGFELENQFVGAKFTRRVNDG